MLEFVSKLTWRRGYLKLFTWFLDSWIHYWQLDYEQRPFKCKPCHTYGHFAKYCKKKGRIALNYQSQEDQWKQWKIKLRKMWY